MRPAAAPAPGPPRAKLRQPANIATTRRRAQPHRASTPPQHGPLSRPAASRASTLSAEPRTVITVVPPPAPTRRPSPESMQKDHGEGRCHHRHSHGDAVHHPPHPQPAGSHRNNTVNGARPYPHGHSQRRGTTAARRPSASWRISRRRPTSKHARPSTARWTLRNCTQAGRTSSRARSASHWRRSRRRCGTAAAPARTARPGRTRPGPTSSSWPAPRRRRSRWPSRKRAPGPARI